MYRGVGGAKLLQRKAEAALRPGLSPEQRRAAERVCSDAARQMDPAYLASFDIILTTYACLARELMFDMGGAEGGKAAPEKRQRVLRHAKRYRVPPSPLTQIKWWRVCLDEAQMIDSPVARAAQMASALPAVRCGAHVRRQVARSRCLLLPVQVNRWCVSGTPMLRGHEDLFGLVRRCVQRVAGTYHWGLTRTAPVRVRSSSSCKQSPCHTSAAGGRSWHGALHRNTAWSCWRALCGGSCGGTPRQTWRRTLTCLRRCQR